MRTRKALKNSINSIICYAITTVLLFFSRRIFLDSLDTDFAGLEGLFKEVLSFVSLADMGASGAITYKIFQAVASGNTQNIDRLMRLYRFLYFVMAGSIFICGLVAIPFIPILVTESDFNFGYLCVVYILQLFGSISSYLWGYYRVRHQAEQKEYINIRADMWASIIGQALRIIILLFFANYLLYVIITAVQNIIANLIIAWHYKKEYKGIKKTRISKQNLKDLDIMRDVKNYIPYKFAQTVYGSTDNMVISSLLGVGQVAFFTNYTLIVNQLNIVVSKLIHPIIGGIADLVYSDELDKGRRVFYALDFVFFLIGSYLCGSVIVIIQPFITVWLGNKYLQDISFVSLLVLNLYIIWEDKAASLFRSTLGHFEYDKKEMILSAVLNLVISIALAPYMKFTGVMLGTIIGHLFIWKARVSVVFQFYLKEKKRDYVKAQVFRFVLVGAECWLLYLFTHNWPVTFLGIILRGVFVFVVINTINIMVFKNTQAFRTILDYSTEILKVRKKSESNKSI